MHLKRRAFTLVGLLCVGLGFVGTVVPGMPTTIFLILALFFFKKGSPRFEAWLLNHPVFGPTLRDWERDGSIKPRTKLVAVSTLWAALLITTILLWGRPIVIGIVVLCGLGVTAFILTRPNAGIAPNPSADQARA